MAVTPQVALNFLSTCPLGELSMETSHLPVAPKPFINSGSYKNMPFSYSDMEEVTWQDYNSFAKKHKTITIEDTILEINKDWRIKAYAPKNFELEPRTVWSFPERGTWATHYLNAKYRGNWAPQVVRNLLLRYTEEGDTVLDPFVGSGTTLIEAKLLSRNGIGIDINREAVMLTLDRLRFNPDPLSVSKKIKTWTKVYSGDARNMNKLGEESIDFVAAHPPYANIISYTKNSNHKADGDLSKVHNVDEFVYQMKNVAKEIYRVLKPGKYCAILIGDTRRHKHHVPISFRVMTSFFETGFILKENVIKLQHNTKTTPLWKKQSIKYNFLLLAHEHLFIFRKPKNGEDISKYAESTGGRR